MYFKQRTRCLNKTRFLLAECETLLSVQWTLQRSVDVRKGNTLALFLEVLTHMNLLIVFCRCLFSANWNVVQLVCLRGSLERKFCFLLCLQSSQQRWQNFCVGFYGSAGHFYIFKLLNWKILVGLLALNHYISLRWHILPPPVIWNVVVLRAVHWSVKIH